MPEHARERGTAELGTDLAGGQFLAQGARHLEEAPVGPAMIVVESANQRDAHRPRRAISAMVISPRECPFAAGRRRSRPAIPARPLHRPRTTSRASRPARGAEARPAGGWWRRSPA